MTTISDTELEAASRVLKNGGLIAFPTETVYGLGANAFDDRAVARIFEAKGRPGFNPLIVHVESLSAAETFVEVDDRAKRLARALWPGPLTLVLPRKPTSALSLLVTAGLETCAIRVPGHPVARALLRASGLPLAAPSANRSGLLSPTTAAHVRAGLNGRVDMILDGGACACGLESTVLDLSTPTATLLRSGALTAEDLQHALGEVVRPFEAAATDESAPKSPGRLLRHYAPTTPLRLNANPESLADGELLLGFGDVKKAALNLSETGDLREAAANLFAFLHDLDDRGAEGLAVSPVPDEGLGVAINDRLRRAAGLQGPG